MAVSCDKGCSSDNLKLMTQAIFDSECSTNYCQNKDTARTLRQTIGKENGYPSAIKGWKKKECKGSCWSLKKCEAKQGHAHLLQLVEELERKHIFKLKFYLVH